MTRGRHSGAALWWGVLLVLVGTVFLAQTLALLPGPGDVTVGAVVMASGLILLAAFAARSLGWWAAIVGASLAGVGAVTVLEALWPSAQSGWSGTIVLGAVGLGFLVVYLRLPARWWPLIPAGTLLTLAAVAGPAQLLPPVVLGGVFLFGMAVTFAAVAVVPAPGSRAWAWIPAAVFAVLGLFTLAPSGVATGFWPAILVVAGVLLLVRELRRPRAG